MPQAIGILVVALLASLGIRGFDILFPAMQTGDEMRKIVGEFEPSEALLEGLLGHLLFAGASSPVTLSHGAPASKIGAYSSGTDTVRSRCATSVAAVARSWGGPQQSEFPPAAKTCSIAARKFFRLTGFIKRMSCGREPLPGTLASLA